VPVTKEKNMKKLSGNFPTACLVLVLAASIAMRAQGPTFTVLHTFTGPTGDGANPAAGLIMDAAGNLYGATAFGGSTRCGTFGLVGCGTIFKLDPSGNETLLWEFIGIDGAFPAGGLLRDAAGNLYGTTVNGGGNGVCRNFGCGSVFKLDPSGTLVFVPFTGGSDGGNPTAGLIMDAAGNLYGTAGFGGTIGIGGPFGFGVVFKLDASFNETVLHSFTGADGAEPSAPLIADAAGNLYSTTFRGGAGGFGTVFELDPATGNLTVLHAFTGGSDGGNPGAGLIMDAAGNLYGTTESGGAGFGTVFKLDSLGNITVLHTFTGGSDGGNEALEGIPTAGLIRDAAGNLFGTAFRGGTGGFGVVFQIAPPDNFSVLHAFTGDSDGSDPLAPLIRDAAGNLFGTTSSFKAAGNGTVFKLAAFVPPPVISGMPGAGCSLWPPNHKLVQVATVTASDAVSGGLAPGSLTVTATSNEPSNDPNDPEIVITADGSGGFVVQLQAERLGTGTGRIYTITATASNTAGVSTTSTATCTVPHDQGQN
jgi:uncharacterized repeat protein (TIGR03803 family)